MLARISEFVGRIADGRTSTLMAVVIVLIVFGGFDYMVDIAMLQIGVEHELHAATQATIVGIGAALATFVLLLARRERRNNIRDNLQRVAELNHRIRNSLQLIADAHFNTIDTEHREMMFGAVRAMDETLKQLFPALGFERRKSATTALIHSEMRR